jgi:AcrR family transcriptional regulator
MAIARAAGTSESQLMKHFGSKEGLLEAIFEQGWEEAGRRLAEIGDGTPPADRLQKMVAAVLSAFEQDPELKLLLLLEGRRIRREGRMVMLTSGYMNLVNTLDGVLEQMRAERRLPAEVNTQALRSAIIGMFEGMLRDQLLGQRTGYPANYSLEDFRRIFSVFLQAFSAAK